MESFVGSGSGGPSALLLEGPAGIGKTTLWHTGLSLARARGHRVLSCRAAEAEARLLRARTGGDLPRPVLLRLHRISGGNPLFALEIARALSGQGVRPAPGEPLPVPEDLQALLSIRLAALPSSAP